MTRLNLEQQQYIMDFYFRCGDQKEIDAGRDLIASNPEAAKLYADLESTLTDLNHVKYDACPDNLVDLTVARLKLAAKTTDVPNSQLHQLLEKEKNSLNASAPEIAYNPQPSNVSSGGSHRLRPFFEILAAAASIAIVAAIFFPSIGVFRSHSRIVACQKNLGSIGAAFASFAQDNPKRFLSARVKQGSPWWKIGDQGQENQSNTRYPFMLVKQGFLEGKVFVCKGYKQGRPFIPNASNISSLNDFPSRHNVTYSFSLFCNKSLNPLKPSRQIVAGDLNPVFVPVLQQLPCDPGYLERMNEFEKVLLNDEIRNMMSMNHRGKGQNVLYCDGRVEFIKDRIVNGDDIFTVLGVDSYTGSEMPSGDNDIFLAP